MSSSGHSDDNSSSGDEGSHRRAGEHGAQDLDSIRKRLRSMYQNEEAKRKSRRAVLLDQSLAPARSIRKPPIRSSSTSGLVAMPPSSGRKKLGPGSQVNGVASGSAKMVAAAAPASSPVRRRVGGGAAAPAKPPASVRDRVNLTLRKMKAKGGARR
ncbi:uncharacterized protein ACA1_329460 [Acanthamoeba castellanii str. Neff]|jgi:hypothetical protein|uniref:Uncharacterized protein n=1 Tax=Acanthamoeba castellanii (strain ATCC 30010 / Neff) TaxID=1257118 RepID=L8GHJ8_ACACF|nr:uncharacterized protein ACA1_329460 [Acanthamoeba castellanii str. Neff]ELR12550.1 hypothetical protein ACA1_329460 [Acanthamoeba castellanii str. Neff]